MANTRRRNRVGWGGDTVVSAATADALDLLSYDPNPVPEDDADLRRFVSDELFKIRDTFYEILDNMSNSSDIYLDISKGLVAGHATVNKFGRNTAVASGTQETVWDGSNQYPFPTTADITHIQGIAGDTEVIEVQGLDTDYALVVQEATLSGASLVALGTALRRIFRMKVKDSTQPGGAVIATNAGATTTYASITFGNNQTQMAVYTVPAGKTAYMTKYYGSVNKEASKDPEGVFVMWARDNATSNIYQTKHTLGVDADGTTVIEHEFKPYWKITEKTDIWINFSNIATTAGDLSAGFDLILVDDGY